MACATYCQICGNIEIEKKTPPRYVSGVRIKFGTIDVESKLSAMSQFRSPMSAKRSEVRKAKRNVSPT